MEIKKAYIGTINRNGKNITGIWCDTMPLNATILEEKIVLFPASGKKLRHKETQTILSSVLITDENIQEYYEEIDERDIENDITQ